MKIVKRIGVALLATGVLGVGASAEAKTPSNVFSVTCNRYQNLAVDVASPKDFLALGYDYGDAVDITLVVYGVTNRIENVPVYPDQLVRARKYPFLWCSDVTDVGVVLAIKNDSFCQRYGITNEIGRLIPREQVSLEVSLRRKGSYADILRYVKFNTSTNRADYASDVAFANYREIRAGRIAPHVLFRSATPCDPSMGCANHVSAMMAANGVRSALSFAHRPEDLAAFAGDGSVDNPYWKSLYAADRVRCYDMDNGYEQGKFKRKMAAVVRRILSTEGPYQIHCIQGKDRTGFVSMLLEAFAGATPQEAIDDYMLTYANSSGITAEAKPEAYKAVYELYCLDLVETIAGGTNVTAETLRSGARRYLASCGITDAEMDELWTRLTKTAPAAAGKGAKTATIVMDVDPGTDDFMALALCSDAVRDGVPFPRVCVATFGNSTRPTTSRNLALALRFLGRDTTLVLGADKPYSGAEPKHSDFHGFDAFGGCAAPLMRRYGLTDDTVRNGYRGMDALAKAILESSDVTYVAVGPLTSLARLLELYPEAESHIGRVYVMGGGVKSFNIDEFKSEYNFFGDPEAVRRVFASKLDITLFPLDITHADARIFAGEIDRLKRLTKDQTLVNCLQTNRVSNVASGQASDAAVIHDALPVLYALDPGAFTVEEMPLTVGEGGHLDVDPAGRRVHVATHARPHALFSALRKAVLRMGK